MFDICIIGAGPSGMMASIIASQKGAKVLLLEGKEDIGKKLLATGNGRCNFTNANMSIDKYYGDKSLVENALSVFDEKDAVGFFEKLGIIPKDRGGYYYPNSNTATSILQALRMELNRLKVDIITSAKVEKIIPNGKDFTVVTARESYQAAKLIVASGLLAAPKLGSDGSMIPILEDLGHHFTKMAPSLCGFYCDGLRFNKLAGIRCDAALSAYVDGELVGEDAGELQLTDYGISGILAFQISHHISLALGSKECMIAIDFMPDMTSSALAGYLRERVAATTDKRSVNEMLCGMLHSKLVLELIRQAGISPDKKGASLDESDIKALTEAIKNTKVYPTKSRSYEFAQVTAGGIVSDEVEVTTLESKLIAGLYFCGEILDVDGICGGYNLQWAWSSGYVAGKNSYD